MFGNLLIPFSLHMNHSFFSTVHTRLSYSRTFRRISCSHTGQVRNKFFNFCCMITNVPSKLLYHQQLMLWASVAVLNVQFILRHNNGSVFVMYNFLILYSKRESKYIAFEQEMNKLEVSFLLWHS